MPFNNVSVKKARKSALDEACRLLIMQLLSTTDADRFVEDSDDLWPLGYCFGMLQASLESVDPKEKICQSDYQKYISSGFGAVFSDEAFGVIQYRIGLSSMSDAQFHAGRVTGATEYVQALNTNTKRAYELSKYMKNVKR
ncbi:hypothetical protein [Pseudomonas kuykendallii]|uniref:hypothetical protein n=1 Tax=Pseudomonas kuykendallii TaxID=1007099 RepID=UPI002353792C|nr:hypothetical protein [Pseudomonas kuykendallii]